MRPLHKPQFTLGSVADKHICPVFAGFYVFGVWFFGVFLIFGAVILHNRGLASRRG